MRVASFLESFRDTILFRYGSKGRGGVILAVEDDDFAVWHETKVSTKRDPRRKGTITDVEARVSRTH